MDTTTPTGRTRNISEITDFLHPLAGRINGQRDPGFGFHTIGQQEDFFNTIWTINHLQGH